jgi:hypothetical protein
MLEQSLIVVRRASRHFSPDRSKFLNYQELVNTKPIRATDGCTFSALGKGDIQVNLPNRDQKPTPITLKNAYYSPHMGFELCPWSCADELFIFVSAPILIFEHPWVTTQLRCSFEISGPR